ncbi:hypothetical protein Tco_0782146, partial [Tanacetum coccineum]
MRSAVVPMTLSIAWKITEQAFVEYASSRTDEAGEGLVSKFMASQDARLSKFETDFKRQQSEMTNKIDTVLKAITDQITGTLPSDTVKNPKLRTHPVLSARTDKLKNHKKAVKNEQARTRESEEYKAEARKAKPQSKSAKKNQ